MFDLYESMQRGIDGKRDRLMRTKQSTKIYPEGRGPKVARRVDADTDTDAFERVPTPASFVKHAR